MQLKQLKAKYYVLINAYNKTMSCVLENLSQV